MSENQSKTCSICNENNPWLLQEAYFQIGILRRAADIHGQYGLTITLDNGKPLPKPARPLIRKAIDCIESLGASPLLSEGLSYAAEKKSHEISDRTWLLYAYETLIECPSSIRFDKDHGKVFWMALGNVAAKMVDLFGEHACFPEPFCNYFNHSASKSERWKDLFFILTGFLSFSNKVKHCPGNYWATVSGFIDMISVPAKNLKGKNRRADCMYALLVVINNAFGFLEEEADEMAYENMALVLLKIGRLITTHNTFSEKEVGKRYCTIVRLYAERIEPVLERCGSERRDAISFHFLEIEDTLENMKSKVAPTILGIVNSAIRAVRKSFAGTKPTEVDDVAEKAVPKESKMDNSNVMMVVLRCVKGGTKWIPILGAIIEEIICGNIEDMIAQEYSIETVRILRQIERKLDSSASVKQCLHELNSPGLFRSVGDPQHESRIAEAVDALARLAEGETTGEERLQEVLAPAKAVLTRWDITPDDLPADQEEISDTLYIASVKHKNEVQLKLARNELRKLQSAELDEVIGMQPEAVYFVANSSNQVKINDLIRHIRGGIDDVEGFSKRVASVLNNIPTYS